MLMALVLILRIVVEIAHHHLEVTLEQTGAKANEHQCSQHHDEGKGVTAKRHREQQIAGKHNQDACGDHAAKAVAVGQPAAYNR